LVSFVLIKRKLENTNVFLVILQNLLVVPGWWLQETLELLQEEVCLACMLSAVLFKFLLDLHEAGTPCIRLLRIGTNQCSSGVPPSKTTGKKRKIID